MSSTAKYSVVVIKTRFYLKFSYKLWLLCVIAACIIKGFCTIAKNYYNEKQIIHIHVVLKIYN